MHMLVYVHSAKSDQKYNAIIKYFLGNGKGVVHLS